MTTTVNGDIVGTIESVIQVRGIRGVPVIPELPASPGGSVLLYDENYQVWRPNKVIEDLSGYSYLGKRIYIDANNDTDTFIWGGETNDVVGIDIDGSQVVSFYIGGMSLAGNRLYFDNPPDTDTFIESYESGNIFQFAIDNSLKFRITSSGNIVQSGANHYFGGMSSNDFINFDAGIRFRFYINNGNRLQIHPDGVVVAGGQDVSGDAVDAFHAESISTKAAVRAYRKTNTAEAQVIQARSDFDPPGSPAPPDVTVWYVEADGDTVKISDPRLKDSKEVSRSYWKDALELYDRGAMMTHLWVGKENNKGRVLNWDLDVLGDVFPRVVKEQPVDPPREDEDGNLLQQTPYRMVNESAMEHIIDAVVLEAVRRIEDVTERLDQAGL